MTLHFHPAKCPVKVFMRFQKEEKALFLEQISLRALELLSPDEVPVFPDLYAAALSSPRGNLSPESLDTAEEPGFFLWGEALVFTPAIVKASETLLEGLVKKIPKQDSEGVTFSARISQALKQAEKEGLRNLRENAQKKACEAGLASEESVQMVAVLLKILGEL